MKKTIQFAAICAFALFGAAGCANNDATVGLMNAVGIHTIPVREKDPVDSWLEYGYKQQQEKNTTLGGLVKIRD